MSLLGFDTSSFMPHGHCVLWREDILWPMVGSDIVIFLSYSAIPFGLFFFYKQRKDLSQKVKVILILFVLFIQLCGLSHLISAYNYWNADYYTELFIKVATALVSLLTAIVVLKNIKALLLIPSPEEFSRANERLKELNESLEKEVQKQTQNIQAEKDFLNAIMMGMNDGIGEITPLRNSTGDIIDFSLKPINDKMITHMELTHHELTMESMRTSAPRVMENGRFEDLKKVINTGETQVYDPSPFSVNGKIFRAVYTKNKINDSILLFIADVTEREELKLANIQSSRLSALGELAGGIAHEINNPLQIIDAAARMVTRQIENPSPETGEALSMIQDTVKRVSKIISNLKRLSRNEVDTIQKISIHEILEDIQNFVSQKMKNHGIELIENYKEKDAYYLNANQVALSQILINLLNNAIDELSDTVAENKDHHPTIEINTFIKQDSFVIEISDNGRGINEDKVDLIFNPLYTSKEVGKGTCLGLSLSKNLAKQMKANIQLKQDNRTRFQVVFPKDKSI